MFPEVQTEYPALSGRKNAISFRKLVESSGLYEKRSLCPDFIATFVAGPNAGAGDVSPVIIGRCGLTALNLVANLRYFFLMFAKTEPDGTGSIFASLAIFAILQIFNIRQILKIVELAEVGLLVAQTSVCAIRTKATICKC